MLGGLEIRLIIKDNDKSVIDSLTLVEMPTFYQYQIVNDRENKRSMIGKLIQSLSLTTRVITIIVNQDGP